MGSQFSITDYRNAAEYVLQHTKHRPTIALTLGSGLGGLADQIEQADVIAYEDVPTWPRVRSSVSGHNLCMVIGYFEGQFVLVFQGRQHYYEGYTMDEVTFHVRVLQALGINMFILTNAAGGLNNHFAVGDLMLITDHINLTGTNPLIGPNDPDLGPRFPDMVQTYDAALADRARQVAKSAGIRLREGVYVGLLGPTYETPAEVRMLRQIGGDAVGMSTVSEVIVARHAEIQVLGLSTISNIAIDTPTTRQQVNHADVMNVGQQTAPRLEQVIRGVIKTIDMV